MILEIADVSKAGARDPYRFSDPVAIRTGTRIEVSGTAGCSTIAMVPHDESPRTVPRRASTDRDTTALDASRHALTSLGYWCPMHPDVQSDLAGNCRRCSMTLVDFRVDLSRRFAWVVESRHAPRAGRPTSFAIAVWEQGSTSIVDAFERVHEQEMHVFIVSEDHGQFEHLHPVRGPDGRFTMVWTPPLAGRYKVYGDLFPSGGSPQMLQRLLIVDGPSRRVSSASSPAGSTFHRGTGFVQTRGGVHARFETGSAVSGDTTRMTVALEDSETGQPVRDLEPYLGAAGHVFVASNDLDEGMHAHPEATDEAAPARQTFDVRFPRAGWWSVWVQVKRRNEVLTFPFAVEVKPKA